MYIGRHEAQQKSGRSDLESLPTNGSDKNQDNLTITGLNCQGKATLVHTLPTSLGGVGVWMDDVGFVAAAYTFDLVVYRQERARSMVYALAAENRIRDEENERWRKYCRKVPHIMVGM